MDDEESLQKSLQEYKAQLAVVEVALATSSADQELQELKENLLEVIKLTEEQLLPLRKKALLSKICVPEDAQPAKEKSEYELFQSEIAALSKDIESTAEEKKVVEQRVEACDAPLDAGLDKCLSELEGKRCRAPHSQEWGELAYHNAMIIGTDAEGAQSIDDVDVCVMFCNPTCTSMKPCSFFLEGHCKFSSEQCKFSHGYVVKLSDIQEFKEPDYTLLQRDALCMAKYIDGLWYNAQILECLDDNKLKVKYSQYKEDVMLSVEDILPLEDQPVFGGSEYSDIENDDSSGEDGSSSDESPQLVWIPSSDIALGDWEKYTKGFGSKLMEQMGYVKGQGLGRHGEGRIDPIEAVILPQGKSLDKCMELRELKESRNPESVEKRVKQKKKRQAKVVSDGYEHKVQQQKKKNVFDFLNSKLTNKPKNNTDSSSNRRQELKKSSLRGLNVQSLQVSEDINKAERELRRLQEALNRNKDKDRVMKSQLEGKIQFQQQLLLSLKSQERAISREQSTRKDHKKLTIF